MSPARVIQIDPAVVPERRHALALYGVRHLNHEYTFCDLCGREIQRGAATINASVRADTMEGVSSLVAHATCVEPGQRAPKG